MSDNDPTTTTILHELTNIRRRLDTVRLVTGVVLAVAVVCLALLLVLASRGMGVAG